MTNVIAAPAMGSAAHSTGRFCRAAARALAFTGLCWAAPAQARDTVLELPPLTVTADAPDPARYYAPVVTTATKTDTPVMETPVSIQAVPQQVLQDQQVRRLKDATENVSGVYTTSIFQGQSADDFVIRGFWTQEAVYRDGYRVSTGEYGKRDLANVEQVEILKGPASILYGRIEPGGMVNYVTKQPQATPHYAFEQELGSYAYYRTAADLTGPLNEAGTLTYRLNIAYEKAGSFRQFVDDERLFFAPVLQWAATPDTTFTLAWDHFKTDTTPDNIGLLAFGDRPLDIPISRNLGEPTDFQDSTDDLVLLTATHRIDRQWTATGRLTLERARERDGGAYGDFVTDADILAGILPRAIEGSQTGLGEKLSKFSYTGEVDLTGTFATGAVGHTLLLGADYFHNRDKSFCCNISGEALDDINIFDPVHGVTTGPISSNPNVFPPTRDRNTQKWYGLYLQDQVELPYHLFLLAGLRFDHAQAAGSAARSSDSKLSPRLGLLWQPWGEGLSLYGSYVENFGNAQGLGQVDRFGKALPTETARQREFGVKVETPDGAFIGTLAYFDLTKYNLEAPDPAFPLDPDIGTTVGKANSHGLELDLSGELSPGWRLLASYAYTETKLLTDSFTAPAGNHLANVPRHGGRLWSTYTIPDGALRDLTLGGGVTLRSRRQGNFANDFQLPGYAVVDAMARYPVTIGGTTVTAQMNIDNLFDKTYYESGVEYGRARIAPGAPLSVIGSLKAEF